MGQELPNSATGSQARRILWKKKKGGRFGGNLPPAIPDWGNRYRELDLTNA
jgi:hypothetical protein